MAHDVSGIDGLIESGRFFEAWGRIRERFRSDSENPEAIRLMHLLSSRLYSKCLGLACSRATEFSEELHRLEALLREVDGLRSGSPCAEGTDNPEIR